MNNMPKPKLGIVAVSRDCFPVDLSQRRRAGVVEACRKRGIPIVELQVTIENEKDMLRALAEAFEKGIDALVIYLGNFGPEGPTALLAQEFRGPVMIVAAAEESAKDLIDGRGDAYCGMLNVAYNIGLRRLAPHIPAYPVGTASEVAEMIAEFAPIAAAWLGLKRLKIFSFGPRPQDFFACNAPIAPLFPLGVAIMENSELDLFDVYQSAKGDPKIGEVAKEMALELGTGNTFPGLLEKLAQYEVALVRFMEKNLGAASYGIFANKCWPAFEKFFGFVPCFVNSRLASRGIPVSCEVDIYGALSEYIISCVSGLPATLLDINNTVPDDLFRRAKDKTGEYRSNDLFMGFHCGNTASSCMLNPEMKYQLIMHRLMEPGREPDITRGTLEGRIRPGVVTLFRLQSTATAALRAYAAEGEILDIDPQSFGSIAVFAIHEMARFYRHVLIEKRFPHHAGVAFAPVAKTLFALMKMLGVGDVSYNRPAGMLYEHENPFVGGGRENQA